MRYAPASTAAAYLSIVDHITSHVSPLQQLLHKHLPEASGCLWAASLRSGGTSQQRQPQLQGK